MDVTKAFTLAVLLLSESTDVTVITGTCVNEEVEGYVKVTGPAESAKSTKPAIISNSALEQNSNEGLFLMYLYTFLYLFLSLFLKRCTLAITSPQIIFAATADKYDLSPFFSLTCADTVSFLNFSEITVKPFDKESIYGVSI